MSGTDDNGDLIVEVSDEVYAAIQRRAEANGRTADEEARAIIMEHYTGSSSADATASSDEVGTVANGAPSSVSASGD